MKICIWQYRPSLHQISLVESLNKKCELICVLENNNLDVSRLKMGWHSKSKVPYKLLVDYNSMSCFINNLDSNYIHVFGGFSSSDNLEKIQNKLIKKGERVFVQSESFQFNSLRGIGGVVKFYFKRIVQKKFSVEGVFAIGNIGFNFFSKSYLNFKNVKLFGYFTLRKSSLSVSTNTEFTITFVGQHIHRKGIDILLKAIKSIEYDFKLQLIGDGTQRLFLENYVSRHNLSNKVTFLGNIENNKVLSKIASSDLLVLPSRFDGWGAVVSEALMLGTPVVASDRCGSSILLSNPLRGSVFKAFSVKSLNQALLKQLKKGKVSKTIRNEIISWSTCISGDSAAQFMIDSINGKNITEPWLN